jgi:DNA-binding response OmpR family regulator
MKVLIVDDNPVVVLSSRRVLEAEGMEVHVATSVEMGETMLGADRFDLLLTDIRMPGRDGFEMIIQARKIRPNMPILMMTGYMTPETIEQGRKCGADNYIAKPFTPDELIEAVRKVR